MSSSRLRSKAAVAVVATIAAVTVSAVGLTLSTASASVALSARHPSVPAKLELSQLVAIPHSHSVAVYGYSTSSLTPELAVPKGSKYVVRTFAKSVIPSRIVAGSASSFWAIATNEKTSTQEVVHLVGKKWMVVKLPALPSGATITTIAASSPSNVWVAGDILNPMTSAQEVVHFNGQKWSIVATTDPSPYAVSAIATSSASNVWAVVGSDVTHFNGTAWSEPGAEELSSVSTIATTSASNAWFLSVNGSIPVVTHWNGTTFKALKVPGANASVSSLSAAGSAAFIAGYKPDSKEQEHQLVMRSTGATWKTVKTPSYHLASGLGVVAFSASSAEVAVSEQTGTSCTNYRAVPIFLAVNATRTTSVTKGKSYRASCG